MRSRRSSGDENHDVVSDCDPDDWISAVVYEFRRQVSDTDQRAW